MRSDESGNYRYETIRPGYYGSDNPSHVHYVVNAPGYKPRLMDLRSMMTRLSPHVGRGASPMTMVPSPAGGCPARQARCQRCLAWGAGFGNDSRVVAQGCAGRAGSDFSNSLLTLAKKAGQRSLH